MTLHWFHFAYTEVTFNIMISHFTSMDDYAKDDGPGRPEFM